MEEKSDRQLMQDYVERGADGAFGELVRRYADLVYSAASRQCGSTDLAADIAQQVFIDLARKAPVLVVRFKGSILPWLYRATRYAAINLLREQRRRQSRENQIMQEPPSENETTPEWEKIAPVLDEAIGALNATDREALLLRFFKSQDFRSIGATLGISDDTAQKRVARSLEKLRAILARRGVSTTAAMLSMALATNTVQPAPLGFAAGWGAGALAASTAKPAAFITFFKFMSMTKIQIGVATVAVSGLTVVAVIQHQSGQKLATENQQLREQVAQVSEQNQTLVEGAQQAQAKADTQQRELSTLRSEVRGLRIKTDGASRLQEENARLHEVAQVARVARDDAAKMAAHYEADKARTVNVAKQVGMAVALWANENNGICPSNFETVSNALINSVDKVCPALDGFELVNAGVEREKWPNSVYLRERAAHATPTGEWERAYLLVDGSVQMAKSVDGNFAEWEAQNTVQVPAANP